MSELKIKLENLQCTLTDPVSAEDVRAAWIMVEEIIGEVAQLEAELGWRQREMERALDAMHDGEYQWQEDDAKAMGQMVEGICETNKRLIDDEAKNTLLAKLVLDEVRKLEEDLRK